MAVMEGNPPAFPRPHGIKAQYHDGSQEHAWYTREITYWHPKPDSTTYREVFAPSLIPEEIEKLIMKWLGLTSYDTASGDMLTAPSGMATTTTTPTAILPAPGAMLQGITGRPCGIPKQKTTIGYPNDTMNIYAMELMQAT